MKLEQQHQIEPSVLAKFYMFLRDRDARIVELFFFALNAYVLILVILPPHTYTSFGLYARIMFQAVVTGLNGAALIRQSKVIRIISSIANSAIMGLITASLITANSPQIGRAHV